MTRILLSLVLIVSWVSLTGAAQVEPPNKKVIPVKPSYTEAAYVPQSAQNLDGPPPPTPREQMYVFWILGKILSYPVDQAESYMSALIRRLRTGPAGTPASASSGPNPFDTIESREIPPAPPALSGPDSAKR